MWDPMLAISLVGDGVLLATLCPAQVREIAPRVLQSAGILRGIKVLHVAGSGAFAFISQYFFHIGAGIATQRRSKSVLKFAGRSCEERKSSADNATQLNPICQIFY